MRIDAVNFLDADVGRGFVVRDGDAKGFVHVPAVERAGQVTLDEEGAVTLQPA